MADTNSTGSSTMATVGSLVLSAAVALFPELLDLLKGAKASGTLSPSTAAAVDSLDPSPSPADAALKTIEAMPDDAPSKAAT